MNKQTYFTLETIRKTTRHFLSRVEEIVPVRQLPFIPERSALLILDMQKYFLEPESHAWVPSAGAILPGLKELRQAFARYSLPVFLTQHVNTSQNAGLMASWWRELITPDHPRSSIVQDLLHPPGFQIIPKNCYDAFYQTSLKTELQAAHVKQVVICGVLTHLCCETTARSAFMHGFEVFFCVDGTATYQEAFHVATLLNLAHGFASLVCVEDILKHLEGIHAA